MIYTASFWDSKRQTCRKITLSHKALAFSKSATINNIPHRRLIKFIHLAIGGIQLELNSTASVLHWSTISCAKQKMSASGTAVERCYTHPLIPLNVLQPVCCTLPQISEEWSDVTIFFPGESMRQTWHWCPWWSKNTCNVNDEIFKFPWKALQNQSFIYSLLPRFPSDFTDWDLSQSDILKQYSFDIYSVQIWSQNSKALLCLL